MGFLFKTKGTIDSEYYKLLEDVAQLKKDTMIDVQLYEDHLSLNATFLSKQPITLDYSKITDVYYGLETEIETKNKSVVKRAFVGGLLLGGVGAIVGAIDGTGTKQITKNRHLFVISYRSSDGKDRFLKFEDTRLYKGKKVANTLKSLCKLEDVEEPKVITSL